MKKYKLIGKYPMMAIIVISILLFVLGPIIFTLIIAMIIVLPIYLTVQLFGKDE
jgi:hypothetical protein